MRVLFVSTVPVFPPNDGIRLPAAHHLMALSRFCDIDFLLLRLGNRILSNSDIELVRNKVERVTVVKAYQENRELSILKEIAGIRPYYGRWSIRIDEEKNEKVDYDVLWCGTPEAVAIFSQNRIRRLFRARKYVAGLSDIYSLVLKSDSSHSCRGESLMKKYFNYPLMRLRSPLLKMAEKNMLGKYSLITVQTDREKNWIKHMSKSFSSRVLVLPNGVNDKLFEIPIARSRPVLCFVAGGFTSIYTERLKWFLLSIYPKVRARFENVKLIVYGKNASDELISMFVKQGIEYKPYEKFIENVYKNKTILVAPVFKGYGIINKVLEGMASGCLVVGDKSAFHGIPEFVDGKHGFIANDEFKFYDKIHECLCSNDYSEIIRLNGRKLIKKHFVWNDRYLKIEKRIKMLF